MTVFFYSLRPTSIKRINKDELNHFLSKPRQLSRVGLVWVIMAAIVSAILVDIQVAEAHKFVEVVEVTQTTQTKKEVKIEVVYNWTPERIEKEVARVFPDAPIMLKVMRCEGGYDIDAYNATNNSHDKGLFQVSTKYHGEEVKRLGLDMNDPIDNLKFARILYDRNGLGDWQASKKCWSK